MIFLSRRVLSIDIETHSDVDLPSCGVYRYVEGDFHILLFAYAFDDEDVKCVDMACGEELPQEVVDAIFDDSIIKSAWNAQFERTCLSKYFGTQLSPDSWQCTMVWAASLSLPLKLKLAAQVLKTGEQKDDAGERLIRYFSLPCKPTKANSGRTRNLPEHTPEDWAKFKSYCIQDVRTERDIRRKLESFPLPPQEWDYYHIGAIDIDHCIREDGSLNDVAASILGIFPTAYFEKSPSGTGLRGFFKLSPDFAYDKTVYYINNRKHGLEVYLPGTTNRFVTVTGDMFRSGTVTQDDKALQTALDTFMKRSTRVSSKTVESCSYLDDDGVIAHASASESGDKFKALYAGNWEEGYDSQSDADMALVSILAFWCGNVEEQIDRIFRTSGLMRDKWDRHTGDTTFLIVI